MQQSMNDQDTTSNGKRLWRKTILWTIVLVIVCVVISILLSSKTGIVKNIPIEWIDIMKAGVVLICGGIISALLERRLFRLSVDKLGPRRSTSLRYLIRLILFITVAVAILTAFGAGVPSVIFGGTFLTVIIGLAGQSIFSNIIGGIWLIFFRPFRIGDSIGLIAWQFPVLTSTFPHEAIRPMYYGHVLDINLMYTRILNQDGYPQLIPNGIIAQSFIENRSESEVHRIRIRFDVPYEIDSKLFLSELQQELEQKFIGPNDLLPKVGLADIYPAAYSVVIAVYSLDIEDNVRNEVFSIAMQIMQKLRNQVSAGS